MIQCYHVRCFTCICSECKTLQEELAEAIERGTLLAALQTQVEFYQRALSVILWLRWVIDEDERRALREFRAAYVANANAQWWPEQHERFRQSERRLDAAEREMQRRGF